jgi:hypothetical protein
MVHVFKGTVSQDFCLFFHQTPTQSMCEETITNCVEYLELFVFVLD